MPKCRKQKKPFKIKIRKNKKAVNNKKTCQNIIREKTDKIKIR